MNARPSLLALLAACSLREDVVAPALESAVADPAILAQICEAEVDAIGPASASALQISAIETSRGIFASRADGSAQVTYTPVAGPLVGQPCTATVTFRVFDGGGTEVNAGTISIEALEVVSQ